MACAARNSSQETIPNETFQTWKNEFDPKDQWLTAIGSNEDEKRITRLSCSVCDKHKEKLSRDFSKYNNDFAEGKGDLTEDGIRNHAEEKGHKQALWWEENGYVFVKTGNSLSETEGALAPITSCGDPRLGDVTNIQVDKGVVINQPTGHVTVNISYDKTSSVPPEQHGLNSGHWKEWMANLKDSLKMEYRDLEMKGLPWIEDLALTLDKHYVDLGLIKMDRTGQERPSESIDIHDMFKAVDGIDKPSRILVEGGPGLGKSTFAAKLAYDWAKGESYIKHFDLVFLIPMRHFEGKLEEIISDAASIEQNDQKYLLNILNNKSTHILILMDGYDEISPTVESEIQPVLKKKAYSHTTIVVTSRPGRFSAKTSQANKVTFRAKADFRTNCFNFIEKRICIKGFNSKQQEKFVNIHTRDFSEQDKLNIASKLDRMMDKEFLKCPLFLLLLIVVLSEDPDINILSTSRTDLYKHVFNCIIKRYYHKLDESSVPDMDLFSVNAEFLDSEKPSYVQLMLQFSEFSLWSVRENKLVFSFEDITKTCNRDSKFIELGFLTQSVAVVKMRKKLLYEPVHRSLLEFGAAYGLWMALMQSVDKDLSEKVISISPFKGNSILCLSFLLGLMGDQASTIFNMLLPYKSFFSSSFKSFLSCLSEIQITPSVLQSLSSFLPPKWDTNWVPNMEENGLLKKYEDIVRSGVKAERIKEVRWRTADGACIPPETEISTLLLVPDSLTTDYIQNIVQKYRQNKIRCKRLFGFFNSASPYMFQFIQTPSVIEHDYLTLHFAEGSDHKLEEFIVGTLNYKTIHSVQLQLVNLDQASVEMIDKMVKNKMVEQLVITFFRPKLEDQEKFDILCSSVANATCLRGLTFRSSSTSSPWKVDLANLFDGGRESWDGLGLKRFKVECTKEIEKELSIKLLDLLYSDVSESAAKLLGHCRISSLICPAKLLHCYELSWSMNEILSELNIIFDETIAKGISPLLAHFRNLNILALTMRGNCSLNVPFGNWLFGCNDFISLRGLEIWDVNQNPSLAAELVKGISGCVTQLPEITSCNQTLELQYLLVTCLDFSDLTKSVFWEIITDPKSPLMRGDFPRLDIVQGQFQTPPRQLFTLFPVEEGFQIDYDIWGTKDYDSICSKIHGEVQPERYSITFNEPSKD